MSPRVRPRHPAREQGIALVTSLLVMLLCAIVVAGVMQLADHAIQRSGQSRDRTAALNAAQAGIQAELSMLANGGACPTAASVETPLPNQALPSASYVIQPSPAPSCAANSTSGVIVATGYVPSVAKATSTTTVVAHINRSQGAPVSGGTGNYDFPDALFTDGTLCASAQVTATCPAGSGGVLNLYGTGGSIPNVTADNIQIGSSGFPGSQLGGALTGQLLSGQSASGHGTVAAWASQIGGPVTGTTVAVAAPAAGVVVQGGVAATGTVALTNATVNGALNHGGAYTPSGTVNITGVNSSVAPTLPLGRPLGKFDSISPPSTTIGTALFGVSTTPVAACPGSPTGWTASFYDIASSCGTAYTPNTYSPAAGSNGITVIVVQGNFTVNIPQTAVGGQLYIVDAGGTPSSNVLTINGSGSTLPVFAFTDGAVNLSGTLVGQIAGHSITVTGASTSMTFSPPRISMPNIAFPVGYTAPNFGSLPNAYISTVSFQYQCPGAAAC